MQKKKTRQGSFFYIFTRYNLRHFKRDEEYTEQIQSLAAVKVRYMSRVVGVEGEKSGVYTAVHEHFFNPMTTH